MKLVDHVFGGPYGIKTSGLNGGRDGIVHVHSETCDVT